MTNFSIDSIISALVGIATCIVASEREEEFLARVAKFANRAKKLGVEPPVARRTATHSKPIFEVLDNMGTTGNIIGYKVSYEYTVFNPELKLNGGWRFYGTIEHGELNILRCPTSSTDGEALGLERFRRAKANCDHCKAYRNRNDTFLVVSADNELKQVGRSCIKDYLGHEVAKSMEYYQSLLGLDDEDWGSSSGGGGGAFNFKTENVIALTKHIVDKHGWTSKSTAYEYGGSSTAGIVSSTLYSALSSDKGSREARDDVRESKVFLEYAKEALGWIHSAAEDGNDYILNLKATCSLEYLEHRHFGLACSLVAAYKRHLEGIKWERVKKEQKDALAKQKSNNPGWFGKPGDKIGRKLSKKDKEAGATTHPGFKALVEFTTQFENQFGITTLIKLVNDDGYLFTWFKSGTTTIGRGDRVFVVATIKGHDTHDGNKQTNIFRCNLDVV